MKMTVIRATAMIAEIVTFRSKNGEHYHNNVPVFANKEEGKTYRSGIQGSNGRDIVAIGGYIHRRE